MTALRRHIVHTFHCFRRFRCFRRFHGIRRRLRGRELAVFSHLLQPHCVQLPIIAIAVDAIAPIQSLPLMQSRSVMQSQSLQFGTARVGPLPRPLRGRPRAAANRGQTK